jgi:Zn-dependent protease with chaperone function
MNALLVVAFAVGVFFATARLVGWSCAAIGDRLAGPLSQSTALRAALALLPVASAASVALSALSPQALLWACHCLAHPHHPHLCLEHASFSWVLVVAAALAIPLVMRSALSLAALRSDYFETSRWAARLSVSETVEVDGAPVDVTEQAGGQALTLGLFRPRVVFGQLLWARLDADGRNAIAAHERAHVARRDPLTLLLVRAACCFVGASSADRLVRSWRRAAEIACDRLAARAVGDPTTVATALVTCGRLQLERCAAPSSLAAASDDLELRIQCLLAQEALPQADRRGDLASVLFRMGVVTVLLILVVGPGTHHAMETLLGWLA